MHSEVLHVIDASETAALMEQRARSGERERQATILEQRRAQLMQRAAEGTASPRVPPPRPASQTANPFDAGRAALAPKAAGCSPLRARIAPAPTPHSPSMAARARARATEALAAADRQRERASKTRRSLALATQARSERSVAAAEAVAAASAGQRRRAPPPPQPKRSSSISLLSGSVQHVAVRRRGVDSAAPAAPPMSPASRAMRDAVERADAAVAAHGTSHGAPPDVAPAVSPAVSPSRTAPEVWRTVVSTRAAAGRIYYANVSTGATSWAMPTGHNATVLPIDASTASSAAHGAASVSDGGGSPAAETSAATRARHRASPASTTPRSVSLGPSHSALPAAPPPPPPSGAVDAVRRILRTADILCESSSQFDSLPLPSL